MTPMTRFIAKELRLLALPAGLVLAGTLLGAWAVGRQSGWRMLFMLAWYLGTPLLAACSFGSEFQHRTMTLLLSQPIARDRLWARKWLCLVAVVVVLAAVQAASALIAANLSFAKATTLWTVAMPGQKLTAAVFVLMVVCSAPLWALLARSTMGAFVATSVTVIYVQVMISSLSWISNRLGYWTTGNPRVELFTPASASADALRVLYALVTLWLGWRVFARFQTVGAGFVEGASTNLTASRWAVLRPTRTGATRNIVRKELTLHRPAFLAAAGLAGAWLVVRLAFWSLSAPSGDSTVPDVLSGALFAMYVPFLVTLIGIVPVGEEMTLGLHEWHLTLPVSRLALWMIKLAVSLAVGFVLVVVVPALLATTVPAGAHVLRGASKQLLTAPYVLTVAAGILLGFWASTLTADTVKATIVGSVAILGFMVATQAARSLAEMTTPNALWLARTLALPAALRCSPTSTAFWMYPFAPAGVVAVWQSQRAFRQAHVTTATLVRMSAALLAVVFVSVFLFLVCAVG